MRRTLVLLMLIASITLGTAQNVTLSLDGHEVEHMMIFFDTGLTEVTSQLFETYYEVLHQLEDICTEDHDRIAAEVMQVAASADMLMNHLEVMQELRATLPNTTHGSANCTDKLTLLLQICAGRSRCFHLPLDNETN